MSTHNVPHRTGRVRSGDVELFYRHFGKGGATPLIILHGANYYDSHDWMEVAGALSSDREVVAFDMRGFGETGWSPSKTYTHAAQIDDVNALLDHLGWRKVIVMGHSRGGGYALLFAARCPERTAGLILADYSPAQGLGRRGVPVPDTQSVGNKPRILPTKEQALASTSRKLDIAPESWIAARLDSIVREDGGGFVAGSRDPDYSNQVPLGAVDWKPSLVVGDLWLELERVLCPILVIKALHSPEALEPADLDRIRSDFPNAALREIDSVHDLAAAAPDALITILRGWLK